MRESVKYKAVLLFTLVSLLFAFMTSSCRGPGAKKAVQAVGKALGKTKKEPVKKVLIKDKSGSYKFVEYGDDVYRIYQKADDDD